LDKRLEWRRLDRVEMKFGWTWKSLDWRRLDRVDMKFGWTCMDDAGVDPEMSKRDNL
jgi:hypothetical protein